MPKQLNVNLSFTADTAQAKRQLTDLQQSLTKISQSAGKQSPLGLTDEINSAISKVTDLQVALQRATTNTGKLDLGQFQKELDKSNLKAKDIAETLISLGPEGQVAFSKLAQSITTAEVPLRRINSKIAELGTVLKNTVKWQISSTILHGFMGAVQHAYGYAQDLNESLNNIRIVTGQSTDQMAEFAKQANKAARELSTTTTSYTDAALIFYQQGLDDAAVKERTDAIIKMANVTKDSVTEVSSYMTAIWNNFDDGSESLEHYADVITALGAATASSSAEIAAGLEKFAAIGQTVGLSYDYATAALATVVATTRQSEDIVGTAFKTIFSRIQGLSLGETLEDGVDLNKYSKALDAVGVQVLDVNGDLRALDDILDDLASKWGNLNTAQQAALAQTVAGTRQYTQLIALMNNWDFMQENLEVARDSEGALQEQADIYAESWEAARDRVKASLEAIYSDLLDDDFFINITNGVEKVITGIHNLVDSFGGLKGILPGILSLFLKIFSKDITSSINNFAYNLQLQFGGIDKIINERKKWNNELIALQVDYEDGNAGLGDLYKLQGDAQNAYIDKMIQIEKSGKEITEQERTKLSLIMDQNTALIEQYQKQAEIYEQSKQNVANAEESAYLDINYKVFSNSKGKQRFNSDEGFQKELSDATKVTSSLDLVRQVLIKTRSAFKGGIGAEEVGKSLKNLITQLEETEIDVENLPPVFRKTFQGLWDELKAFSENPTEAGLDNLVQKIKELQNANIFPSLDILIKEIKGTDEASRAAKTALEDLKLRISENNGEAIKTGTAFSEASTRIKTFSEVLKEIKGSSGGLGGEITALTQGLSSFVMVLNTVKSIFSTLADPDLTGLEKFERIISSLLIAAPMLISAYNSLGKSQLLLNMVTAAANGPFKSLLLSLNTNTLSMLGLTAATEGTEGAILSLETVVPILLVISLAIMAIVGAIKLVINQVKKENERIKESAKVAQEHADALREEANAHNDLIASMESAIKTYEKDASTKEDLDEITRQLAEAYDIEGAALDRLGGRYTDILEKAKELREEELEEALNSEKIASELSGEASLIDARKGKGFILGGDYNVELRGYGDESQFEDILTEELEKKGIENDTSWRGIGYGTVTSAWVNENDPRELVKLYDSYVAARDRAIKEIDPEDLRKVGKYSEMNEWIEKMSESIEIQREHLKQYDLLSAQLDSDSSDKEIQSIEQYNEWIQKVTETFEEKGYSEKEIKDNIDYLIENSINPDIKQFKDLSEAIQDVVDSGTTLEESKITEIFNEALNGDKYELATLAVIDWANVTVENYERVIEAYQRYNNIVNGVKEAENREAVAKEILDSLKKDEVLDSESYQKLADQFSQMGLEDEFSTFLSKNFEEKQEYLKDIITHSKEESIDGLNDQIAFLESEEEGSIKYYEDLLNSQEEEYEKATIALNSGFTVDDINRIKEDYNNIIPTAMNSFQSDEVAKELTDQWYEDNKDLIELIGGEENLYDLFNLSTEEFLQKYSPETSETNEEFQKIIDNYNNTKDTLEGLKSDLKTAEFNLETKELFKGINSEDIDSLEQSLNEGTLSLEQFNIALETVAKTEAEGLGFDYEEIDKYADYLMEVADSSDLVADSLKNNRKAALEVAIANERLNKGLKTLGDNFEDWEKVLKDSSKEGTSEYAEALTNLKEAMSDILNIDSDAMSTEFIQNNLEDIKAAAEGDVEAIEKLRVSASQDILLRAVGVSDFSDLKQEFQDIINELQDYASNNNLELGAELDNQNFINSLNEMIKATNMTAEQVGNYLQALGYDADVELKDGPPTTTTQKYINNIYDDKGNIVSTSEGENIIETTTQIPVIKALTYTGSAGGAVNFKNTASGKSKKSGGGDKSKQKESKDKKDFNDEFDRFYPYQKAIDDLADTLSDLDKVQSHLAGNALIESLQKENKLFDKQKENVQALLDEQIKYRDELQESLAAYGTTFDETTGNLTNYTSLTKHMVEEYNKAVITYNESAQDEVAKSAFETATKEYEKFKDLLSKYQGILTSIQDSENDLDDLYYQQVENNLKSFEVDIQLNLDIEEATRKVNDFLQTINDNFKAIYKSTKEWTQLFNTALKNVKTYTEDNGTIPIDIEALKQIKEIIDNENYDYTSNTSLFVDRTEAIQKYKELTESLMTDAENLYKLYEDAWGEYLNAIEEDADRWEAILKGFENVNKEIEHNKKIIELIYGNETRRGRQYLDQAYNQQLLTSLAMQQTLNTRINALQKEYSEMIAAGAVEGDEDLDKISSQLESAQEQLKSEIENYIETIQSQLENTIQMAKTVMDESIWGGDFSEAQQRWQDSKEQADGYYDSIQKIYQLESLESKWRAAINSTSSVKIQQQLKAIMDEQLSSLENKNELSETDIELAEKRLEVYKAQIALEEAQNNKNTMKLVRNEQGNWTYQYVADTSDIEDKQQDLLDKVDQWRTASIEATEEIEEKITTAYEDFTTRMIQIMNDVTLSEQERDRQISYLNDIYWGENGIITKSVDESNWFQRQANEGTYQELFTLYQQDESNYQLMADNEKAIIDQLRESNIDSFSKLRDFVVYDPNGYEAILEKAQQVNIDSSYAWDSMAANAIARMYEDPDSVKNIINKAYEEMTEALNKYIQNVKRSEEASGIAWTNVENQLGKVSKTVDELNSKIIELVSNTDNLSTYRLAIKEIEDAWLGVKSAVENLVGPLDDYMKKLKDVKKSAEDTAKAITEANSNYSLPTGSGTPSSSGSPGSPSSSNSALGSPSNEYTLKSVRSVTPTANGAWTEELTFSNGKDSNTLQYRTKSSYAYDEKGESNIGRTKTSIEALYKYRKMKGASFDTGGYTGQWNNGNSDGRLAMLHQKEIVLNQADTKNLLDSVKIMRDITSSNFGSNIQSILSNSLNNLVNSLLKFGYNKNNNISNSSKENIFNITAEFPNANNVEEIQEAILSLPNLASQYLQGLNY